MTTTPTSKTKEALRVERRRAPMSTDLLTVAVLWPKRLQNVGTLLRTCDAVGARMVLPRTVEARSAAKQGNTIGHISDYCVFVEDPWVDLEWAAKTTRLIGVETGSWSSSAP